MKNNTGSVKDYEKIAGSVFEKELDELMDDKTGGAAANLVSSYIPPRVTFFIDKDCPTYPKHPNYRYK